MIEEAINATCHLLGEIDPVELRSWFERFELTFDQANSKLIEDPIAWSSFLGTQCDLLQEIRLHQKTIADVGNELAQWDRQVISFNQFATSLDGLSGLVSEHVNALTDSLDWQNSRAGGTHRSRQYLNCVCGLSIVLVAINKAIEKGDPRDFDCAAMANFGASLTCGGVQLLFRFCKLDWTLS